MNLRVCAAISLLAGAPLTFSACGSSGSSPRMSPDSGSSNGSGVNSPGNGSGGNSGSGLGGSQPGSGSGVVTNTGSGGNSASSGSYSGSGANRDGGSSNDSGSSSGSGSSGSGSNSSSSGSSTSSSSGDSGADAATTCVKGQIQQNEVVMLGDSYMDIGNVGPTIQMVANATYRTYYLGGAALNYGSGQLNIPYQFDSMAVPDNPDIKVVITDGGGNDILIDNRQCLTTPVPGDTMCHMVIDASIAAGQTLEQDMASKGVQHIVYFFYPHVDTTAVLTGANANDWLDYAYPKVAAACCGAANVPTGSDLTCQGTGPGADCVFIDTRPEFVGHNDPTNQSTYWFQDGVHPTQPGADAIANKVWVQMQKYCVAQ